MDVRRHVTAVRHSRVAFPGNSAEDDPADREHRIS